MNVQHRLLLYSTCPVDGTIDRYIVTVLADRVVPVERIREVAAALTAEPIFQEDLTVRLAEALDARVRTVGRHTGTRTRCTAG